MKYVICISARAKDCLDRYRQENNLGRFPLRYLVHNNYYDMRPIGARRSDVFSLRQRPVNVQTNLTDERILELLELVDTTDVVGRYAPTDHAMISNLLGTFLDAAIMGDLVDTTGYGASELIAQYESEGPPLNEGGRRYYAERASKHNLDRAAKGAVHI